MNLPKLAWRNLWRQKRRTILTLFSIAFGGFLAIMFTSMQDKNWAETIDMAARLGGGHVSVQHPEFKDTPTLNRSLTDTKAIHEAALSDPLVTKVVDRISGQAMLSTSSDSFGAMFIAFDPTAEDDQTMSFLGGIEGPMFEGPDDKGIILGDSLAENLDAELGDKVVYTLMDKEGEMVQGMGRLRAVVNTGADSLDAMIVLLPINKVREVLSYGENECTSVAIYIADQRRSNKVATALRSKIETTRLASAGDVAMGPAVKVYTWDQLNPDLAGMISMKIAGSQVMSIIILMMVAAGIFNTLFVSVMERLREFGIMMAIGHSPTQLFGMVVWESFWLACLGLVGSVALAAYPYHWLSTNGIDISSQMGSEGLEVAGVGMSTIIKVGMFPESGVLIAIFVVGATMLAGLYPAYRAATVQPVESIKLV